MAYKRLETRFFAFVGPSYGELATREFEMSQSHEVNRTGASICLQHCEGPKSLPSLFLLSPPFFLEVGPLIQLGGLEERCKLDPPVGSGAKPQPPTVLAHF